MIIDNVYVFTPDKAFVKGGIILDGDKIRQVYEEKDAPQLNGDVLDGKGCYAIPGLIDLHFHGCKGDDFCDGDKAAIGRIAEYEASVGVTAIAPATMTLPVEELEQILHTAAEYKKECENINQIETKNDKKRADFVGINMEGPFISASKKGAQAEENILHCDYEYFCRLQKAAKGLIKLVDLAPEEPGAMEFIEKAKDEVVISLAHTASDYDTAKEAIQRGASHATHLYNAMPPLNHRNPGVIGAVRDSETCHAELICDGVHIHPSVIRATFAMFGAKRMILISDSMRATGLNDGDYTLGGQPVKVKGNLATLHDGTIAGSATNLMDCVRFVVKKVGLPFETAVMCASENPAKEIGIFHEVGSISAGKKADFVLLDKDLNIVSVYVDGKEITC